jgi:GMP synthase (glutamine-hydrolysing)
MSTPRRPTAVILTHEEQEGPGLLGPALRRAGFQLEERLRAPRPQDATADALVVMGGPMGVYEADRLPFLASTLEVVRARLEAQRPVLGVCLGAQLIAAAAGARVYPGDKGPVLGLHPITLTEAGLNDPLFAGFERTFDVPHWHADTFDPVPGATVLASSARYPHQAFRVGQAIGFQFHPEVDLATWERWLQQSPDELAAVGLRLSDALSRDLPRLRAALHPLTLLLERSAQALARAVGVQAQERFLFTVEHAQPLPGGVVLTPGIPRQTPIVRVGEPLLLLRPDGSRLEGVVRGMASFGETGAFIPLLVQLEDQTAQIPSGTEVLTPAAPGFANASERTPSAAD